ncbi:MAG: efflux RND transporter periplasmic adaptor subunit, partial [Planctomycetota bacterium]
LKKDSAGDKAAGGPGERSILYWRAPMDPNFVSDRPGKSPMGMDLVPVYADQEESPSAHTIRIDPVTVQNMGIRTTTVKRGPLIKTIRSVGRVDYDEQRVTFFNTKFEGWIEELHVAETGRQVQEGQALFDVFSRDLWEAQAAFLASLNLLERIEDATYTQAREDAVLQLEADRMRLRNYDITDEQIAELADTREVRRVLAIHSPAGGIVTDKMALEGMYVKPGMKLYTIADLSRVWVYVDIYEYQLPWVSLGQTATMTLPYVPGRVFVGKVVYIYPYLEQQSRVIKVRLEFENANLELKPGMYANITLAAAFKRDALLVPREAYIDSGTRKVSSVPETSRPGSRPKRAWSRSFMASTWARS